MKVLFLFAVLCLALASAGAGKGGSRYGGKGFGGFGLYGGYGRRHGGFGNILGGRFGGRFGGFGGYGRYGGGFGGYGSGYGGKGFGRGFGRGLGQGFGGFGLHGSGVGRGHHGLIASTNTGVVTDSTWKCTTEEEEGWHSHMFNDSHWPFAVEKYVNGAGPWRQFFENIGINPQAYWIWTNNTELVIYCRKRLCRGKFFLRLSM